MTAPHATPARCGSPRAPAVRRPLAERGSAIVEFVSLAVLVLVPTIYLIATLAQIQAAAFAVEAGAREASRVLATATSASSAIAQAQTAVALAAQDQDLQRPAQMAMRCDSTACFAPGAGITVTVRTDVPLPLIPDVLARHLGASIEVHATHHLRIDDYSWIGQ